MLVESETEPAAVTVRIVTGVDRRSCDANRNVGARSESRYHPPKLLPLRRMRYRALQNVLQLDKGRCG